jgi:REP element-mobilizing transposase RayT
MWNDTDVPLAYFISFRTYGTWLHGDERGSIDRHNNAYGTPKIPANEHWESISTNRMNTGAFFLNADCRSAVEEAIKETCDVRGWLLRAINIRTNHGHAVVDNPGRPAKDILAALKANATRQLRERGLIAGDLSPWAAKGSMRNLWNEQSIWNAVQYTLNGQGGDLPKWD